MPVQQVELRLYQLLHLRSYKLFLDAQQVFRVELNEMDSDEYVIELLQLIYLAQLLQK